MAIERRSLAWLCAALAAVAVASAPALDNELVWDDLYVIEQGTVIHDWANLPAVFAHHTLFVSSRHEEIVRRPSSVDTWRPVTLATFMWDSTLSGRDPWAYHLTNLLVHLACVVLVFLLAREILPAARRPFAPLAAAFFGLTPLLAEAHVWINGRSDLFCALFGLAAILVWRRAVRADRRSRRAALHAGSAALFALGLLSKEVLLFSLPALLAFPSERARSPRDRLVDVAPLVLVAIVYLALRSVVLGGLEGGTAPQLAAALVRLPTLLLDGATQLVVPTQVYVRSLDDDYRALGLGVIVALDAVAILVAVLVLRKRRSQPVIAWSLLWLACTLAPAAVIATMLWPGFGRYLYLPCAGLAVALADVAAQLHDRAPRLRRAMAVGAVAYLALLGVRLALFAEDWQDEDALYGSVIDAAPDRPHGWGWLGMTRLEQGRVAEALPLLARADALAPHRPRYLLALGEAKRAAGDAQGALDAAATGIQRYDEQAADFHLLAARVLAGARPDLAAHHVSACLREAPDHPGCRAMSP